MAALPGQKSGRYASTDGPGVQISPERVQEAIDWMVGDGPGLLGEAEADLEEAQHMMQFAFAEGIRTSNAASDERRKAEARTSPGYRTWAERHVDAVRRLATLRAKAKGYEMVLRVFQTVEASKRSNVL